MITEAKIKFEFHQKQTLTTDMKNENIITDDDLRL